MKIVNPATEEVITELNEDSKESAIAKLNLLCQGQQNWSKQPLAARVEVLKKFTDLLAKNIESLSSILTSEVGKPLQQSRNEVKGACARANGLTYNEIKHLS